MEPDDYNDLKDLFYHKMYVNYNKKKDIDKAVQEMVDYRKIWRNIEEDSPIGEDDEGEEEEIDENLELVEFYADLLIEKIGRFSVLGKYTLSREEAEKISNSDLYSIEIEIDHTLNNISVEDSIKAVLELKQLEDGIGNISISIGNPIRIKVKVNSDDIKDLDPANKASAKFNL